MPNTRLEADSELKPYANQLRKIDEDGLRRITAAVCNAGLLAVEATDTAAIEVVALLQSGGEIPLPLKKSMKILAKEADEQYLDILEKEDGCTSERCLYAFRLARVLMGITSALDSEPRTAAFECIYEIGIGVDKSSEFFRDLNSWLLQETG